MIKILTGLSALLQIINELWNIWQRAKMKAEIRQEVASETQKEGDDARKASEEVRENVSRLSDDELDRRLRKYQRD